MLTIPQIRDRLNELAEQQADIAREIQRLTTQMYRRTSKRTAVKSRRITQEVRNSVRATHTAHPSLSHQEIADIHNINPGRVSEILYGKR